MQEHSGENVFEIISNHYYELTTADRRIADFITANPEVAQQAGISELAEACGAATATISRFSRKLGYDGFNEMRIAIARAVISQTGSADMLSGKIQMDDSFEDVCKKLHAADKSVITQTLELVEPTDYLAAVDLMHRAGKVVCMGQGGSSIMSMEAAHLFSTVSGKFFSVQDDHLQAICVSNLQTDDVILYFSYSGSVRDMMETLPIARKRGVKVILITRYPKSPGAEYADVTLRCGSSEGPLQLGSVSARISQLFMLDVLFSEFCRRDYEKCLNSRERIASALAEKHLE